MFTAEAQLRVSTNMTLRTEKAFVEALEIKRIKSQQKEKQEVPV